MNVVMRRYSATALNLPETDIFPFFFNNRINMGVGKDLLSANAATCNATETGTAANMSVAENDMGVMLPLNRGLTNMKPGLTVTNC